MKDGKLALEFVVKLLLGIVVIILVISFAIYLPEIAEEINEFFRDFNFLERFK